MTQMSMDGVQPSHHDVDHIRVEPGQRCPDCGMMEERCSGLPQDVYDTLQGIIQRLAEQSEKGWAFAKTMPGIPHQYVVRKRAAAAGLEADFDRLIDALHDYGYARKPPMMSRTFKYVNVDGWRYWTMRKPSEGRAAWHSETTIINRAPLSQEGQEALRRTHGYTNTRWYECDAGHRFGLVIESFDPAIAVGCPACGHHAELAQIGAPA